MSMQADNVTVTTIKPTARSRVTNGSRLLPNTDGRSVWARRLRDLCELYTRDLGGVEAVSLPESLLIRRASCLVVELELLESKMSQCEDGADERTLDAYQRCTNTLRRTLESLSPGLQRRPRQVQGLPVLLGEPREY